MAIQYSLEAVNDSHEAGSFCIFQSDPNANDPQVLSLAWLVERSAPHTKAFFTWTDDYAFVWAETGFLVPGVTFNAGQTIPADLSATNQINFTNEDGALAFADQTAGPAAGSLYIREEMSVPVNMAAVGIGMSGAGTFAAPALPGLMLIFTPNAHPKYWITFGDYHAGEVLDITTIENKAEIAFPKNVFSMTATYGADCRWTVSAP